MKTVLMAIVLVCASGVLTGQKPEDEIEYRMLKFDQEMTAFEDGPTPRSRVRANFYWGKEDNPWDSSPGQVSIEHGLPVWKPEYAALFAQLPAGRRWRLGSNYWTNISTSFPLSGPSGTLPAGYYYIVLEKGQGDAWKLVFLRPSDISRLQIDPWHVNRQTSGVGVFELDLRQSTLPQPTDKLEIRMVLQDENPRKFHIDVRFGPNQLASAVLLAKLK